MTTTPKALLDLIVRLSDEADLCRNEGADDIARLLDEARVALEAAQRDAGWISVADRLPPAEGEYLTYSSRSAYVVSVSTWLKNEGAWQHEWLRKKRSEARPKTWVTHWRPMLPPPIDAAIEAAKEG